MRKGSERSSLRSLHDQSGQALVEGAFVLLMIFLFLFGVFEMGRLLQTRQALTDAAREGARTSIAPLAQTSVLPTRDDVKAVVRSYLRAASIYVPEDAIDVNQSAPVGSMTFTKVTVTYRYPSMTLRLFGLQNVIITGSSLMRNETSN